MKILIISPAFAPNLYSEAIVTSKLTIAFLEKGWSVHVISKNDMGISYTDEYEEKWKKLKNVTFEIKYSNNSFIEKFIDTLYSSIKMGYFIDGIRWARRAYEKALELNETNHYDIVISRSPSDIAHLPALKLKKRTGIKWIANWNDPCANIWPEPYVQNLSFFKKYQFNKLLNSVFINSDYVTFPSDKLIDHFSKFVNINKSRTRVIPHISDSSRKTIEKVLKPRTETIKFCHAGNLSIERDPERFFKALSNIKINSDIKLEVDLIGSQDKYVEKLINKYNLNNIVIQKKGLPYFKMQKELSEYDFLLIIEANMYESIFLPSKLIDYSQSSIPIVAITPLKSCVTEYLNEFGGGVAIDCSSSEIIEVKISSLLKEYNLNNLDKYDSTKLHENFSHTKIIHMYKKLINTED